MTKKMGKNCKLPGQERQQKSQTTKSWVREAASSSTERDEAQEQAPGGRQRGRQKDALMPGSDVEGKRSERCRIKNGGEYRAEPHG